jgi:hypothetical protein
MKTILDIRFLLFTLPGLGPLSVGLPRMLSFLHLHARLSLIRPQRQAKEALYLARALVYSMVSILAGEESPSR